MSNNAKTFFDRAVLKYCVGDLEWLIDASFRHAGPLLACVVNGIDLCGGMLNGFHGQSEMRSCRFMTEKMNLEADLAKFIYKTVRCGVAHEGGPKSGVLFFVCQTHSGFGYRPTYSQFLFKDSETKLYFHVTQFARRFVDTVRHLDATFDSSGLVHVPSDIDLVVPSSVLTDDSAFPDISHLLHQESLPANGFSTTRVWMSELLGFELNSHQEVL
ncbi:MAG: hypothetical protein U0744_08555 [Gemmataceae bacterium]